MKALNNLKLTTQICYTVYTINIPSHATPASSECWQLWVKIGLLEHSSSWLALEVQETSSRKIGPVPAPNLALLYAIPPTNTQVNQISLH